jgi:glucose 1-dehydrogenase
MRALVLRADGSAGTLNLEDVPEPRPEDGELVVEAVALGICGTDRELVKRHRLVAGERHMVIGHEALGRVLEAPKASGFLPGQLVVGTVRRPDPVPCFFCASGESDLCENGGFTERGISGGDGFGAELYTLEPEFAVHVDPALGVLGVLIEPTSIVAKGWERLERLVSFRRRRALVLGAGPIGLLAALLGVQRGYEVHVVDQMNCGVKPAQVWTLGAVYHDSLIHLDGPFDVVMECTSVLTGEAVRLAGPSGAVCFVAGGHSGLSGPDLTSNRTLVGIVNSNRRHFVAGQEALRRADRVWLARLLSPCVRLDEWRDAFAPVGGTGVKAVIRFKDAGDGLLSAGCSDALRDEGTVGQMRQVERKEGDRPRPSDSPGSRNDGDYGRSSAFIGSRGTQREGGRAHK